MAMWAISKSPLIINADIQKLSLRSQNVLKMKNLIDINQNAKHQAKCIKHCDNFNQAKYSVFMTDFINGTKVIAIINWKQTDAIVRDLNLVECDVYAEIKGLGENEKNKQIKTTYEIEIKDLI